MKHEIISIGTIRTPFKEIEGMPVQTVGGEGVKGEIHLKREYLPGIRNLEQFSHLQLIFIFHEAELEKLDVKPFLADEPMGVFSTFSPIRPNHLGSSIVKLNRIEDNIIYIENLDILDNTPLVDIKPYVPHLYTPTVKDLKTGWFEDRDARSQKAEREFI
ncbi:MAG: tRNA (N6-threonylcarbamoyladenosine(37)-N6)-methyltransferase TrmO [Methanobrevibacter sp.]|uniref:tRNA (N6-threonylcarbamoyladenosine(37)-N6)-methyltransferase TrmO n=1 Tax=Methanobrevibacter sp. TaxID=66852 RepID=UPI0026DFAF61|nr:tRNA (N6-threonylcarbamoyladenosine(37)-N6)-methyltransferase TrmO [Methanobrevibacter sp.]MDO5849068.1 tRNA (N6-threonylcarbamoyladenosine(37)-N6)-methyltransferase TrmO [Methanobrevibacter sp.]